MVGVQMLITVLYSVVILGFGLTKTVRLKGTRAAIKDILRGTPNRAKTAGEVRETVDGLDVATQQSMWVRPHRSSTPSRKSSIVRLKSETSFSRRAGQVSIPVRSVDEKSPLLLQPVSAPIAKSVESGIPELPSRRYSPVKLTRGRLHRDYGSDTAVDIVPVQPKASTAGSINGSVAASVGSIGAESVVSGTGSSSSSEEEEE